MSFSQLAGFMLALFFTSCSPANPLPPFPPEFTEASGEYALNTVRFFCEQHPSRDSGTPEALAAAQRIASLLTIPNATNSITTNPRVETFSDETPKGPLFFHNVLSELPARNPRAPWVVLVSHYDTKSGIPNFTGANDGASSTALLIVLHAMLAHHERPFNFLFAFLDGEECQVEYGPRDGLHGSRHLAQQLKSIGRDVRAVVVLDMIGDADLHVKIPFNCTPGLRARALAASSKAGTRDHFSLSRDGMLDDHVPFLELGFPALNFIDFNYGPENSYWHTSEDTPDKLSANSFLVVGRTVLQLIADLQP